MQKNLCRRQRSFNRLLHFRGPRRRALPSEEQVSRRARLAGLVLGLLAGRRQGDSEGADRRGIFCFSLSMLVIFASTASPTLSTSEGWPMRPVGDLGDVDQPSVPERHFLQKAPKGIKLDDLDLRDIAGRWVSREHLPGGSGSGRGGRGRSCGSPYRS